MDAKTLNQIPDRLQSLEEDLQRGSMHLRYGDWLLLKRGQCGKVAGRIRRRQSVTKWVMLPALAGLVVFGTARFILRMQLPHTEWVWFELAQPLVFASLFVNLFAIRSRALRLASRLEAAGDGA